ncbi:hypothetical protein RSSM_02514 [Rhodopirellula sallentina SM41]|uniref:Uncharacterized protein n=1 Tax=Rhodopirellula sallentina SM41 TaxID=1263870 RepID=M5U3M1_9BACT|nr:hypothetical protein RSSM_02514 [Rhodopirellula sallentina SM41]
MDLALTTKVSNDTKNSGSKFRMFRDRRIMTEQGSSSGKRLND